MSNISLANLASNSTLLNIGTSTTFVNPTTQGSLVVSGPAIFKDDIIVNGKSVSALLNKIEDRLAIMQPNPALEEEFEQLRILGQQYKDLEAKLLDQKRTWAVLKS